MNAVSEKTRNENLLRTKTKNFKEYILYYVEIINNLKIESKLPHPSTIWLVKYIIVSIQIYSTTYNEGFSPNKSRIVAQSAAKTKNNKSAAGGLNP